MITLFSVLIVEDDKELSELYCTVLSDNGYKVYTPCTANTTKQTRSIKYTANKKLTAYTNTNATKKAFIVKKDQKVNIYSFYQKGNKKYIKVKNSLGKYGYIKVGSSPLFEPWLMVR